MARARHRVVVAVIAGLLSVWTIAGFATTGDDDWIPVMIRLVLLLVVTVATVWLVATGFDARYPAAPPLQVAARLIGVAAVAGIALLIGGDPWVFAGDSGSDVSVTTQATIVVVWLLALGAAFVFRHRRPAPAAAGEPTVAGPPPTGFRATVRRWSHLVSALLIVGPLVVFEGIVVFLFAYCGAPSELGVPLATLLVLSLPVALPGIGVLRDRQVQRRPGTAVSPSRAVSPGFAVAFGTMALVAFAHIVLVIGSLVVFATGTDPSDSC